MRAHAIPVTEGPLICLSSHCSSHIHEGVSRELPSPSLALLYGLVIFAAAAADDRHEHRRRHLFCQSLSKLGQLMGAAIFLSPPEAASFAAERRQTRSPLDAVGGQLHDLLRGMILHVSGAHCSRGPIAEPTAGHRTGSSAGTWRAGAAGWAIMCRRMYSPCRGVFVYVDDPGFAIVPGRFDRWLKLNAIEAPISSKRLARSGSFAGGYAEVYETPAERSGANIYIHFVRPHRG